MDKTISITDAKKKFFQLLREASEGNYVVTQPRKADCAHRSCEGELSALCRRCEC